MSNVSFADLGLAEPLLRALEATGYTVPTPIQARTIPALLQGRDVLGIAQTGTGKTAAFALPVLQLLAAEKRRAEPKSPRALVLAPTRELAVQIAKSFDTYGRGLGLRLGMVIGGLGFGRQIETLRNGVDILVATPGRLLDLVNQGHAKLGNVTFLVLDEADRMFDMGFIKDVRRITAAVSKQRQTLLFSATMPGDVAKLSAEVLRNPERVEIAPQGRTVERIDQRVYFVNSATKRALLSHLLSDASLEKVIVFTRTKRGANRVAEALEDRGVSSEAIHGNKSQNARQKALDNFSRGRARVLVATDLASRGIDVQGITHVINYELPADAESYVHRIGRTARAGASGVALSFCDSSERGQLKSIERLTNQRIAVVSTPSNEDMPAAPPMRPRAEREANDEDRRQDRGGERGHRSRGPHRGPQRGHSFGRGDRSEVRHPEGRAPEARAGEGQPQGGHHNGGRQEGGRPEGGRPGGGHHQDGHRHGGPRHGGPGRHGGGHRPHAPAEHQWASGDYRDGAPADRPQEDRGGFAARPQVKRPYTPRPQGDRPFGGPPRGPGGGRRFGGGGGGRGRGRSA